MDEDTARDRLREERADVRRLLQASESVGRQDRLGEDEPNSADDRAQQLTAEGVDDAIVAGLQDRLAALDRAERRLDDGSFGRSVRSGMPISDERLAADPAAELTFEEANEPRP
jgi:RNA polymerase-binding transcription factor